MSKGMNWSLKLLSQILYMGAVGAVGAFITQEEIEGAFWAAAIAVISVSLGTAGQAIDSARKRANLTSYAEEMWAELRDLISGARGGRLPSFFLYLRPFLTQDQLPLQNVKREQSRPWLTSYYSEPSVVDFEQRIVEALKPIGPTVALGAQGESPASVPIRPLAEELAEEDFVEDRWWKQAFVRLVDYADGTLIIPSNRPGTKWELCQLKKRTLFHKCVFLMPPKPAFEKIELESAWETARSVLAKDLALQIPAYREEGGLFTLQSDGSLDTQQDLDLDGTDFRARIQTLLGRTSREKAHVQMSGIPRFWVDD